MKQAHPYADIIHLPHPISKKHPQMSPHDRAAQFSPFSALPGYENVISETVRLVDKKIELSEDAKIILDRKQQIIADHLTNHPIISITYYIPDGKKMGGKYITTVEPIKKIDKLHRELILDSGAIISMDDVLDMESDLFNDMQ